ncbi:MAG TPA: MFS transporter [Actinophytocola sp.]|uniref:MFS transporter n=1 Tax=Actinophytocola sp. TaxID=1872138 RepID=UPI002DBD9F63|nr:MFS transporter [Actinophytocola sp.]HEU5469126.1 MFS transporter [Actinophytocola sp.]
MGGRARGRPGGRGGLTGLTGRAGLVALITASATSALGSRVSMVAIPWLVLTTTGDPTQMGLVIAAQMIPYLLSGVFGTPVAERLGIRLSAITADVVSCVTTAVIAAAADAGLPVILAMVAISGAVRGAGDRTKNVMLRPMAEAAGMKMSRMTAVHDGLGNGATLVGAPLGGLLVFWLGAQGAIWVDAASYAVCVLIMLTLVRPPAHLMPARKPRPEPYLTALRAGAVHLSRDRLLFGMLAMTFFANAVNQAHTALFVPLWVSEVLHSPAALGTVLGAFAAGAVTGNLVFIGLAPKLPAFLTFTICLAISGAPRLIVLGVSDSLGLVLSVTFLCGFAVAAVNPILGVLLYERVPVDMQTRVFGLVATVSFSGYPVGGLLGGWAVTGFGLTAALLLGAGVYLVATLVPLLRHRTAKPAPVGPAEP